MSHVIQNKLNINVVINANYYKCFFISVRNKAIIVARRAEQFVAYNSCARV